MATKKATREDYMNKYGPVTTGSKPGRVGQAMERVAADMEPYTETELAAREFVNSRAQAAGSGTGNGPATRADYIKKYGPITLGKNALGQSMLSKVKTSYQKNKEQREAAEEFAKLIGGQTPKYGGTALTSSRRDRMIDQSDYTSMVEAGKQKPSIFNDVQGKSTYDSIWDRVKGSVSDAYENAKLAKYRDYNYMYMTDDEKDDYLYLVGKYGLDEADNYMKTLKDELNKRSFESVAENVKEKSKENPAIGLVGNLSGSLMSGAGYVEDALRGIAGKEANPYSIGHGASLIEEKSREGIKEAARENVWDSAGMDFLVDTGLSMGQTAMRLPLGSGGIVYAGLGAATGAEEDALERGASRGQAMAQGAAQGIAEGFFERFSIEGLEGMKQAPVYGMKDVAMNLLKQAGVEGSEEMATELSNTIFDQLIMKDKGNFSKAVEQYKALGNSAAAATAKAALDVGKNLIVAGAGGALSGGIMGGGALALGGMEQVRLGRKSSITDYQEFADSIDTDAASYQNERDLDNARNLQNLAQEFAKEQAAGRELSNLQRGAFERDLYQFESALLESQNSQENASQAKTEVEESAKYPEQNIQTRQNAGSNAEQDPARSTPKPWENAGLDPVMQEDIQSEGKTLGENGQKSFVANYDGMMSIPDYRRAFERYYDAGRYNVDVEIADRSAISSLLTPEQAAAAYKAGAQDRNLMAANMPAFRQGAEKQGNMTDLTGRATKAQGTLLSSLGKKTGLNFEIVEQQGNAAGGYNPKTGTIQISVDSENFLQTTTHELTHFLKDYAPEYYEGFKSVALSGLMEAQGVDYDTMYNNYARVYEEAGKGLNREEILDEIVADATGKFLNDENFIDNVVQENRSVAQKIIDFITDMIDSIKQLISNNGIRKSAEGLAENLEYFENARDMWAHGMESAGERRRSGLEPTTENGNEKYMLEKPELATEKQIEKNFEYVRNMKEVSVLAGDEFVADEGGKKLSQRVKEYYDSLGNVVHNEVVGDVILNNRAVKDDVGHGINRLKAITFQAVPEVIENGKVLRVEKNWKNRGYDSAVIGAKIKISEGEYAGDYYEICVVKVREDNRMYLHEAHTIKMDDESSFKTRVGSIVDGEPGGNPASISEADAVSGNYASGNSANSYIASIFDKLRDVKAEKQMDNSAEGILFQLEGVDDDVDVESLLEENAELREANSALERQLTLTQDYEPRMEDINRVAGKMLKEYNSSYPKETLVKNLSKLYNYIRNSENVDGAEVTSAATALGRGIIEKASMKDTVMQEQYKDVLKRMRETKMVLPETYRGDLDSEGGYSAFRKKYLGRIRLGNEGIGVDTAYEELAGLYPDLFDPTLANPADQIKKIAEVVDSIRPQLINPYHANLDEMAYIAGQEIFNEYFNVRNLPPTKADKMQAEIFKIQRQYNEQLEAYKTRLKAEYESDMSAAEREIVQKRQEIAAKLKALGDGEETREARKKLIEEKRNLESSVNMDRLIGKMRYQRKRDASESRKHKARIMKDVQEMSNWLTKPTDKKHVPEQVRTIMADFLGNIDYSSNRTNAGGDPTARTKQWGKLKDLYASISEEGIISGADGDIYMEVDPAIVEKMTKLTDAAEKFDRLDDLSLTELRTLREVVQSMKHSIQDANRFLQNKAYERVEDGAAAFNAESAKRRNKREYAKLRGAAERMLQSDMLDAYTMFERMGPAASSFYQELRDGFDKKVRNTKLAQDYIAGLLKESRITSADIRKWSGARAETHEFKVANGSIRLTTAQIMSLYALNNREQARGHIYSENGGIKSAPQVKQTKTGTVIEKSFRPVKVTALEVDEIIATLTPEQKRIADGIVKFFTTQTSSWGNEVSMQMYGYKKFMAPNYFPIVSDKNYIATKDVELGNGVNMSTLRNMGATKATVEKANNPIIIEDIFDVYTRQADQMGSYNAFVVPLSDMQKFYNFKEKGVGSVKEEIERTFGKDGLNYIRQLMVDVNGTAGGNKDLASAMIRNMKSAAVGANIRTAIQQPTAYVRALAEIDAKYLIQGLKPHVPEAEWELAKKYCPIAQWKDWGYFDINVGRSMKSILMGPESFKENLTEKSMWLAGKGDEIAWKRLWEASKAETKDLHPEFAEGSEEFYEQAGKRMGEIIDRTQVVDTVLHRSKLMKDKNGLVQMYTSFMSEPTKSYNMLYRALADVALNPKDKAARKRAGKILGVWVLSGTATSLAAAVVDAVRDDEDEKWTEKYRTAVGENLMDNVVLGGPNMIPLVRDVVSIFQGYEVKRIDVQAIQQIYYLTQKIRKHAAGESDLTIPGLIMEAVKPISTLSGVGANNATRDIGALIDTLLRGTGAIGLQYSKERIFSDIKSKGNLSMYMGYAMKAYAKGDKETGDRIIRDIKESGIDLDSVKKKYVAALKEDIRTAEAVEAKQSGDMGTYEGIIAEMEEEGYEGKYVAEAIKSAVTSFNSKISEAVKAQENKEDEEYKKVMKELEEAGYTKEHIKFAMENVEPEAEEDEDEELSLYSWSDLHPALKHSKPDFDRVVNAIWEDKEKQGWDETKIRQNFRSSFTKKYKPLYQNGTDAERKEIRKLLYGLKIKGKRVYEDEEIFKDWIKEKSKKKK